MKKDYINHLNGQVNRLFLFDKFIFILFTPFFIWSFLGGHKQIVFGISSDHVATIAAFFASALVLLLHNTYKIKEIQFLTLYLLIFFIFLFSVFNSPDVIESLQLVLTHVVYFFITFGAALYFKSRTELFFKLLLFSAVFSAIIMLISFVNLGLGSWMRLTIPVYENGVFSYFPSGNESSSDPNVLSYFIYLGALIVIFVKGFVGWWRVVFLVLLIAGLLTLSRSGFVAFFMAMIFYALTFYAYRVASGKAGLVSIPFILRVIVPILLLLSVFFIWVWVDWSYFHDLILDRIYSEGSNSSRIERLVIAVDILFEDPFLLLVGHGLGFSRLTIDPHNYYLSTMIDSGFISLILILFAFICPFITLVRRRHSANEIAFAIAMTMFFLVIAMFYWQMRTYYFILLILWVLSFSQAPYVLNLKKTKAVG